MFCSISGETPKEPVISKYGHVFEKSLIEKSLDANGKCPVTGDELSVDDLIPLKVNKAVKPRPVTATSMPALIQMFQNEWDALMLETHQLKQQLDATRQELAHALYQNDAASRVIARLLKERDEARQALNNVQAGNGPIVAKEITEDIKHRLLKLWEQLSSQRKKRAVTTIPQSTISSFSDTKNIPALHKSSAPGVLCASIHPAQPNKIVTGGADKTAVIYNCTTGKKESTLVGHSKAVTHAIFHPSADMVITASADKTARTWVPAGNGYRTQHKLSSHTAPITALSLQPSGSYALTASTDCSWEFHDLGSAACLEKKIVTESKGFHSAQFHPDGLLLGTGGGDGIVRMWDLRNTTKQAATFTGHSDAITALTFSENGYYLVTADKSNSLRLWDLRHPKKPGIKTIDLGADFNPSSLDITVSGQYVAAAGSSIKVFVTKTLEEVCSLAAHKQPVTCAKWAPNSQFLLSTSLDRTVKIWSN